jgi:outer membrane protein TolC
MSLAKWTLLTGWAVVVSAGLIRIAVLEEQVGEAQAAIAVLRQEVLGAPSVSVGQTRDDCDQARAEIRMLQAEATALLNKLLLSVNELPKTKPQALGPPVWVDPDRSPGREVQGLVPVAR